MPTFIIKPVAGEDFYVAWSTVVDAPTAWGDREELMGLLRGDEAAPARFERADEFGTSMQDPALPRDRQWFGWHKRAFMLHEWPIPNARHGEVIYQVPRENVRALCERYESEEDPTDLLTVEPIEGDDGRISVSSDADRP